MVRFFFRFLLFLYLLLFLLLLLFMNVTDVAEEKKRLTKHSFD